MKLHYRWLSLLIGCTSLVASVGAMAATDLGTKPITVSELTKGVRASINDPDAMVIYLRRAETCDLRMPAYTAMKKLKAEQPNNATVLGGYCFAYAIAVHGYAFHIPRTKALERTTELRSGLTKTISEASRLNPNDYLSAAIDALIDTNKIGPDTEKTVPSGVFKLRKLVEQHPRNAWLRFLLGRSLLMLKPGKPCPEAVKNLRLATSLPQPIAHAALTLHIYFVNEGNDKQAAKDAKAAYLRLLDPGYVMPPEVKQLIAQ